MKSILLLILSVFSGLGSMVCAQIPHAKGPQGVQVHPPAYPPPTPLPGAPPPRRGYFWIFGDGTYSRDSAVDKSFEQAGTYDVLLYTNDRYSTGGPPPPAYSQITTSQPSTTSPKGTGAPMWVTVNSNRPAPGRRGKPRHVLVPKQQTVVAIRYGNPGPNKIGSGHVLVGYNPQSLSGEVVKVDTVHPFFGETISEKPAWLGSEYQNYLRIAYDSLAPREERNVFVVLRTVMEPDSTLSSPDVPMEITHQPAGGRKHTEESTLYLSTAEDPNQLSVDARRLPWRRFRPHDLEYTVAFQNKGEGPANAIRVEVREGAGLDFTQLEVLDWYPPAPRAEHYPTSPSTLQTEIAADGEGVTFLLENIYLPGLRQPGGVEEDSTQGYITFRVPTARRYVRQTHPVSRITFDRQKALETRPAKTRLIRAHRLRVEAGPLLLGATPGSSVTQALGFQPEALGWQVGLSVVPYRPEGWYFSPQLSLQQVALHGAQGSIRWWQVGGSPLHVQRRVAGIFTLGMGGTVHYVLGDTEAWKPEGSAVLAPGRGLPLSVGSYLHLGLQPFRRGPALWCRAQTLYLDYLAPTSFSPYQVGLQAGLGFTF